MSHSYKILTVFDFDHTIVDMNTDIVVFDMIENEAERERLWKQEEKGKWTKFMNKVLSTLHETGHTLSDIEVQLKDMKLVDGFLDLFTYLKNKANVYDCIIMSDSNSWFISTIATAKGFVSCIKQVFTNQCEVINGEKLVVHPCHQHNHSSCPENMCKGELLVEYLSNSKEAGIVYDSVCYIGDGSNDFCPCTKLQPHDYVLPRIDFALAKKLQSTNVQENKLVKASILPWKSGYDILHQFEIIERT